MPNQRKMSHILNWVVVEQYHSNMLKFQKRTGYKKIEIDRDAVDNEIQLPLSKTSVKAGITKISFWTCSDNICV